MTPLRKNVFIRKVKDITIGGTLAITLLGSSFLLQSCGDSDDGSDYEEVEVYSKGVKTYISETSKGVFKITEEAPVPVDSSVAVVTYLDGKKDTLTPKAVKALIDTEITQNANTIGKSENLSNALLFGGMGFLLAKTMSPNYSNYRPDLAPNNLQNSNRQDTVRRYHRSHFYPLFFMEINFNTIN